ncbi:MAG: hypothetical protein JNM81_14525, partial [Rhodospirillaceae bacterium]|nr:hypothetical protein [Rhodospirillaceae bacterium]
IDAIREMDGFVAQVAAMDMVITVSNTTVHVAGALGIPTMLLVPFNRARQWYWLRASSDCKWYPSVKYVYQSADGTWTQALSECRAALQQFVQAATTRAAG